MASGFGPEPVQPDDDQVVLTTDALVAYLQAVAHTIAEVGPESTLSPAVFLGRVAQHIEILAAQGIPLESEQDLVRVLHAKLARIVHHRLSQ